jgi:hypothetical protein
LQSQVEFRAGDLLSPDLGSFDHVLAMDSMIYYEAPDLGRALAQLCPRVSGKVVFTVAPRTAFLMAFWGLGKLFPRSDRSPVMIPHTAKYLRHHTSRTGATGSISEVGFRRIGHMPDVDAIRRSRLKKMTLFEMPDDEDIVQCRAEYIRLAETLWAGTEPLAPEPLEDRRIFELLGFD